MRRAIAQIPWPQWDGRPQIGLEQYAEPPVQFDGWNCERRVIVTRTLKPANPSPQNVFDELKNQWSFAGFCSGQGGVTETAARLLRLTYNLWSLFVRVLQDDGHHHEAVTSRDELLVIPAKLVETGRQKTLKPSVGEQWWSALSRADRRHQRWLAATAPQLNPQQTFERYLYWNNPLSPEGWLPKPAS